MSVRLLAALLALLGTVALMFPMVVLAQVPPSPTELDQYRGLHAAAHKGDVAAIRKSIDAVADLNVRDRYGRTPLHVATYARQHEAIKLLAKAGADLGLLEDDLYDPVTIAAVADDEETLRLLLALGASAKLITSRYEGTALIAAAHLGHDGIVRQLIAAGAPIDHVNNLHWTATIEAVVLGNGGHRHQATLRALVDAGANLQLTDRFGSTPLMLAKQRGFAAMEIILDHTK